MQTKLHVRSPSRKPTGPPGALRRWRDELRAGTLDSRCTCPAGQPWHPDECPTHALWLAACWESSGHQAAAQGWHDAAAEDFAEATDLLEKAGLATTLGPEERAPVTTAASTSPTALQRALARVELATRRITAKRRAW